MGITRRHPEISVPEKCGDREGLDSVFRQAGCERMPQIVEPEVRDVCLAAGSLEASFDISDSTARFRTREYQIRRSRGPQFDQDSVSLVAQRDSPILCGLGVSKNQHILSEINAVPSQAEQLPPPAATFESKYHQRPQMGSR